MTEVIKYMDARWSLGSGISFRGSLTKTNIKMLYIKRVHIAVAKMYSGVFLRLLDCLTIFRQTILLLLRMITFKAKILSHSELR